MIIRLPPPENRYYQLRREIAEDTNITYEALGVLLYLLVKPSNWKIRPTNLRDRTGKGVNGKTGKHKIYRILNELVDAGYIARIQPRDETNRVMGVQYCVSEDRELISEMLKGYESGRIIFDCEKETFVAVELPTAKPAVAKDDQSIDWVDSSDLFMDEASAPHPNFQEAAHDEVNSTEPLPNFQHAAFPHTENPDITNILIDTKKELVPTLAQSVAQPCRGELIEACFLKFWEAGLTKKDKIRARSVFERLCKTYPTPQALKDFTVMLITDIHTRLYVEQEGIKSLHPKTYLNNRRWEDEISAPAPLSSAIPKANQGLNQHSTTFSRLTDRSWAVGVL